MLAVRIFIGKSLVTFAPKIETTSFLTF